MSRSKGGWSVESAVARQGLSPVADGSFSQPSPPPQLMNMSQQSRGLAASPSAAGGSSNGKGRNNTAASGKPTSAATSAATTAPVSRQNSGATTAPISRQASGSGPASAGTSAAPASASTPASSGQQQLWTSLKLDPLLISHASGLHRVLRDVQTLKDYFQSYANHILQTAKTGAALTAHLSSLFKEGTGPPAIQQSAAGHASMADSALNWFSSRFHNELLVQFDDWLEDCEDVLTQLGLVQKTRHELDGLQDEVEGLFNRKLEAPHWDAQAESSLQRRLENSKEKLAQACMLYDGQRRGVEKSMTFLLAQRAQLFHQVLSCFGEFEYRHFRDAAAHSASFIQNYAYGPMPPSCQFAEEPFASSHLSSANTSASALLLTLPYFQWPDPARPDGSGIDPATAAAAMQMEGPSVRAIRRSMAQKKERDAAAAASATAAAPAATAASGSRRNSVEALAAPAAAAVIKAATTARNQPWEDQAERWSAAQQHAAEAAAIAAANGAPADEKDDDQDARASQILQRAAARPAATAAPASASAVVVLAAEEEEEVDEEEEVEDLSMAEVKQAEAAAAAAEEAEEEEEAEPAAAAEEEEKEEEEEDEEAIAAALEAKRERKRAKKERKEQRRAKKAAKKLRREQAAEAEQTDSEVEEEEAEADLDTDPSASPNAAASPPSSTGAGRRNGAPPRSTSTASMRSDATDGDGDGDGDDDDDEDVFVSPDPLLDPSASPPLASSLAPRDPFMPQTHPANFAQAVEQQSFAAAALNLPAKLLPSPAPAVPLHPALWESVSLPRIKGSIWGRILVDHLEFDDDTDEIRDKFALVPHHLPVFEGAFRAEYSLRQYAEAAHKEKEQRSKQEAMQLTPPASAAALAASAASAPRRAPTSSPPHSAAPSDRFQHMRLLDGSTFVAAPANFDIHNQNHNNFPAPPFPMFSAKQWYVSWMILSRVLFPLTPTQVLEALYKLDDKILTPERVAGLVRIMPTSEQRHAILRAAHERQAHLPLGATLTPLEQLFVFLSLKTKPSLGSRLQALSFQTEFGPLCFHLEQTLDSLEKCVVEIKRSENLRLVFAVLLNLGNRLNLSHAILPAYGFTLDFLPQLRRIRMSSGSQSSLLDFLVYYLSSNYPTLSFASFSATSFPHLTQALRIDEYLFQMELRHVNEQYVNVKQMNDEDEYEKQNRSVQGSNGVAAAGAAPASNAPAALQSQSFSYSSPSSAAAASGSRSPPASLAPPLPFPVSSFPPRAPRFLSYVQARLTVLRHKHAKVRMDLAELMRFLCVPPAEVADLNLDAALAAIPGGAMDVMPPLGEVIAAQPTPAPAAATAAGSSTEPAAAAATAAAAAAAAHPTHLRFPWQRTLRTLHRFLIEFSQALQDHVVAAKVSRQPSKA